MKNELFYEYEQILLGNIENFSPVVFNGKTDKEKENIALNVFQIAIENYLCLSPMEAKSQLNKELIDVMKLDLVIPYIRFPVEFDCNKDYFYVLSLIYPQIIKITESEKILHYYVRILENRGRFMKGYFTGPEGRKKACVCLKYAITQEFTYTSVEELYLLFSEGRERGMAGKKMLKKYKLDHYCYDLYDTKIDFLHDALPDSQKNEFLYFYYKYKGEKAKVSAKFKEIASPYIIDDFPKQFEYLI